MGGRFFPVTLLAGRIYVDGFGERGPWDTGRLAFQDESVVEVLVARVQHRRVVTAEDMLAVLLESEGGLPAIRPWIIEGLEEFARGLWEESNVLPQRK
jgi:hypothetical protein